MKFEYTLPEKAQLKGPNFIREVFERGAKIPGFISFGIGNPASEAIPVEAIQKAFDEVVHTNPIEILQYGPMMGDDRLREQTVERLVTVRHMPKEGQQLLLSIGAGQDLGLVPRTICNPGDEVYMDTYTFTSAIGAVKNMGAIPVAVEGDEAGMDPDALRRAIKRGGGKGRYIYLIPNFQNPTGVTMPLSRRKEIYAVAAEYGLFIYEDDPYGEICFTDEIVPTFKSFDEDNRVIYAGSYSKTLSAGLRVGYLYGPQEVIEAIQRIKNSSDGQMPLVTQRVVSHLLDHIDYDAQIQQVSRIYKEKADLMMQTFRTHGSSEVKFIEPTGGMFIWMTMPEQVDCDSFFELCMDHKVGIVKGAAFATDGRTTCQDFRLSFTFPSKEQIETGMKIVGQLSKECIK
ncbi:PLP-dependent aminotransferase family protein [uncultured Veillonella sp.]|uniref:aminotransferase-like domain-containing protein n=1 Tax=uncultured Veillonella sp. TaxID=159268 RepID=UPI0026226982|nr:PLP-dependent aminotransferase family protein [uncultured Veillonella sp.]